MKFVYLKLKFQKAFKCRDDHDGNVHFDNTFLIVLCNLETNLKKKYQPRRAHQGYSDTLESLVPTTRALVSDLGKSSSEALLLGMLECPPKSKNSVFITHCTK